MSKKKIESLTAEQEAQLPVYAKRFTDIGLDTARIDRPKCIQQINDVYKIADQAPPKHVLFFGSPIMAIEAAYYLIKYPKTAPKKLEEMFSQYNKNLISPQSKEKSEVFNNLCYGNQDSFWLGFYSFFRNECGLVEETAKVLPLENLSYNCGWFLPYSEYCFVSEKPTEIHLKNKQLHKDLGPAVAYSDGFGVYALNGIRMKEAYVLSPAKDLSVGAVMREVDIDVRRELLGKIGLERFLLETKAQLLDSYTIEGANKPIVYGLYSVDLGNDITAKVLKMDNPSINAIHVEGVEDTCNTVKEALAWRNGFDTYIEPIQLS